MNHQVERTIIESNNDFDLILVHEHQHGRPTYYICNDLANVSVEHHYTQLVDAQKAYRDEIEKLSVAKMSELTGDNARIMFRFVLEMEGIITTYDDITKLHDAYMANHELESMCDDRFKALIDEIF